MSALVTLTNKLAAKLEMGDGDDLIDTLKATAFRGQVSDAQMTALMVVANQYGLNPWTKEIYAFPDKGGIVPVVGVDGWSRIINSHPQFDGIEFEDSDDACTCTIYRKDRSRPTRVTEYMNECRRSNAGPWQSHPRRMLRHKATIQCARLAFGFTGIVEPDEAERIVEKDMGAAQVEASLHPPAKPEYPADRFAAQLQGWRDIIASGRKTPAEIIATVETKFTLNEGQKASIRAKAEPAEPAEADSRAIDGEWVSAYEAAGGAS
jgi:phage recombination protein Bet